MSQGAVVWIPVVAVALGLAFDAYCLSELNRAEAVLYFPARTWVFLICLFTPFGGISYLMVGRPR